MDYLHTDRINTKRSSLSDPLVLLLWEYRGDSSHYQVKVVSTKLLLFLTYVDIIEVRSSMAGVLRLSSSSLVY